VQIAAEELLEQAQTSATRRTAAVSGRAWTAGDGGRLPWPACTRWDDVRLFDEDSVSCGALGRFPSSQLMPLIRQFLGASPPTVSEP